MNRTKHLGILLMGLLPLQASAQDNFRIEVKSAKPLQDICFQLEERFHWRITYEDPPVLSDEETRTEILPSGTPRLFIRASPMSVDLAGIVSSTDNYKAAVLTAVLNAYHNSGNRAEFRFTQNGDFIHVLPTKVMGINGEVQDFDPLLDTRVSIPRGSYFLGAFVSSLMSQISQRRGIGIAQATVPTNLFAQTMVTVEAQDEIARDVLMRVFEDVSSARIVSGGSPLRLTWYLLYNPNGRHYFLNVSSIAPAEAQSVSPIVPNRFGAVSSEPSKAAPSGSKGSYDPRSTTNGKKPKSF